MRDTMMKLFNLLLSPIGQVTSRPMKNIETFPSKQMYLYLSLVERKVAEFYHNIWLKWLVFIAFSRQLMVSLNYNWKVMELFFGVIFFSFDELLICLCINFAICFLFMRPMSKVWDPSFTRRGDIEKCQSGNRPLVCWAADEHECQHLDFLRFIVGN